MSNIYRIFLITVSSENWYIVVQLRNENSSNKFLNDFKEYQVINQVFIQYLLNNFFVLSVPLVNEDTTVIIIEVALTYREITI